MKKYLLLLIISFLISQSFEFEPKMKIEFKELRNLDESLDSSNWNGSNFDTELPDSSVEDQLTKEKKIKPTLLGFGVFQKNIFRLVSLARRGAFIPLPIKYAGNPIRIRLCARFCNPG